MKVLTIRQPWASLIVADIKDVENRSWPTKYRGKLGIHAGMRVDAQAVDEFGYLLRVGPLPRGALIGSVTLVDCIRDSKSDWADRGVWHWVLADAHTLVHPRKMGGRLGLWNT
jgi:hypothetical protein